MFDHKSIATEGLYPGLVSAFSIALLGIFQFEIFVEQLRAVGGGGFSTKPFKNDKYKIKIVVKYKNKIWNYENFIHKLTAKILIKIMKVKLIQPSVLLNNVNAEKNIENTPTIKVYKK